MNAEAESRGALMLGTGISLFLVTLLLGVLIMIWPAQTSGERQTVTILVPALAVLAVGPVVGWILMGLRRTRLALWFSIIPLAAGLVLIVGHAVR